VDGANELSELLKSNSSLTLLDLTGNKRCVISFSLNTDNDIGDEGAINLSEALKSNTSLTELNLSSNELFIS
jgi:hypothetical protein